MLREITNATISDKVNKQAVASKGLSGTEDQPAYESKSGNRLAVMKNEEVSVKYYHGSPGVRKSILKSPRRSILSPRQTKVAK